MKRLLQPLSLIIAVLLAACASMPSQIPRQPAVRITPKVTIESGPALGARKSLVAPQASDLWDQLRGSFAMADCDADPAILEWARQYTHNPGQFESRMSEVLPRLAYVQKVAAQYGVAGEFVLLPWVESRFQAVPGRRNRPAGIWQIMPITAGSMGLRIDNHYDGRLDIPASADAVMKLLKAYHDQFHDWRIADYAYNAGEFKIRKLVQTHGLPADVPVIPKWPVQKVTRAHLTQLLAIACVVREPDRFNVSLPSLAADEYLVKVNLSHSMPMAQAARHAGMSLDTIKELNAAFRSNILDVNVSSYLMLPASHVAQFQAALLDKPASATVADSSPNAATRTAALSAPATMNTPNSHPIRKTHRVKRGESLWQIAHHYSVNVTQLQQWNHLRGDSLKPGQVLQLDDTD